MSDKLNKAEEWEKDFLKKKAAARHAQRSELDQMSGSAKIETERELLEMAVFWMRKSQDYSPPRCQDISRMLECASYIEERINSK